MEFSEFLNSLNWSRKTYRPPAEQFKQYDFNVSDDEDDIFFNHMNEIDSLVRHSYRNTDPASVTDEEADGNTDDDNDIDVPIDPRTRQAVVNVEVDCRTAGPTKFNLKFFNRFPVKSQLNKVDHLACINAIATFYSGKFCDVTAKDRIDQEIFFATSTKRKEEKVKFDVFVKQHFDTHLLERYRIIDPPMKEFVQDKLRASVANCRDTEMNSYTLQSALPTEDRTDRKIEVKSEVLIGVQSPTILQLPSREPFVHCVRQPKASFEHQKVLPKLENDDKINTLLQTNEKIEFVASLSSIYCLTNHCLESLFDRVHVKMIGNRKVMFIEKPLPKEEISSIRMSRIGHREGLKIFLLKPSPSEPQNFMEKLEKSFDWKLEQFDEYLRRLETHRKSCVNVQNVSYDKWQIQDKDSNNTINILLRTKWDGATVKEENGDIQLMNLSVKMEYKVEFGAELMTRDELIQEWCQLKFQPDSTLLRFRIDATTSKIVSRTELNLQKIESELKNRHNISSDQLLRNLFGKLEIIKKFPVGEYVLQKSNSRPDSISIYRQNDGLLAGKSLRIDEYLNSIEFEPKIIENVEGFYNGIDENEVTVLHRQSETMPCAFPFWNKKKGQGKVVDDKSKFNNKIQKQIDEKTAKLLQIKRDKKRHHRQSRTKRKREQNERDKEKLAKSQEIERKYDFDYESPIEFDESGNVKQNGLTNIVEIPKYDPLKSIPTPNINFDEYMRQAQFTPADLKSPERRSPRMSNGYNSPSWSPSPLSLSVELNNSPQTVIGKAFGLPNLDECDMMTTRKLVDPTAMSPKITGKKSTKESSLSKLRKSMRVPKLNTRYA